MPQFRNPLNIEMGKKKTSSANLDIKKIVEETWGKKRINSEDSVSLTFLAIFS